MFWMMLLGHAPATIEVVDLTNVTIVNGHTMDLYRFEICADPDDLCSEFGCRVGVKSFTMLVEFDDDGGNDDLTLTETSLYLDGSQITDEVSFQDQDGDFIEDGTLVESDELLTITFEEALVIDGGECSAIALRVTPEDFGDGDAISIALRRPLPQWETWER